MAQADLSSSRGTRLLAAVVVALLHGVVAVLLVRAFAPQLTDAVARRVAAALTVTVTTPPPPPPSSSRENRPAGAAAAAGKRATPRESAAEPPRIVIASPSPAPPVAGHGDDAAAGANVAGAGTGAGGGGSGIGSGSGGDGRGGGWASAAVKVAGDISSARDYPRQSRELRLGDYVIVALTVGTDGRVRDCRIHRPSRDAEADRITCKLAAERFRFRPATDAAGNPAEAIYGWKQRWFDPSEKR